MPSRDDQRCWRSIVLDRASAAPAAGGKDAIDDPDFRKQFSARLKSKGLSSAEIRDAIERAKAISASSLERGVDRFTSMLWRRNDEYARAAISSIVAAYFAGAVSDLNTADMSGAKSWSAVDAWVRSTQSSLDKNERDVYNALKRSDAIAALVAAEQTRQWAERRLSQGAQIAASVARRRRQSDDAAARGAVQAVEVGNALRGILRAVAMVSLVRYHASGGDLS